MPFAQVSAEYFPSFGISRLVLKEVLFAPRLEAEKGIETAACGSSHSAFVAGGRCSAAQDSTPRDPLFITASGRLLGTRLRAG